jgi:hypothetical protein
MWFMQWMGASSAPPGKRSFLREDAELLPQEAMLRGGSIQGPIDHLRTIGQKGEA